MKKEVTKYLQEIGRKGGAAGTGEAKARSSEQARAAAYARWGKFKQKTPDTVAFRKPDGTTKIVKQKPNRLSARFSGLLNNLINRSKTLEGITPFGCTQEDLIWHVERQFHTRWGGDAMTWDNRSDWHIHHLIPLATFDKDNIEQMIEANHWSNLQPLWEEDHHIVKRRKTVQERAPYIDRQLWTPRATVIDSDGLTVEIEE